MYFENGIDNARENVILCINGMFQVSTTINTF